MDSISKVLSEADEFKLQDLLIQVTTDMEIFLVRSGHIKPEQVIWIHNIMSNYILNRIRKMKPDTLITSDFAMGVILDEFKSDFCYESPDGFYERFHYKLEQALFDRIRRLKVETDR